jgi:hypothetical protein
MFGWLRGGKLGWLDGWNSADLLDFLGRIVGHWYQDEYFHVKEGYVSHRFLYFLPLYRFSFSSRSLKIYRNS